MTTLPIGQLAQRTGLSVRTLRYYDSIGLLKPQIRGSGGVRCYGRDAITRLQHIVALRTLGFGLSEIRLMVDCAHPAPLELVEQHLTNLAEKKQQLQAQIERLEYLAGLMRADGLEQFELVLKVIATMNRFDQYYSKEQLEFLEQRQREVGQKTIQAVQQQWQALYARGRELIQAGVKACSPQAQELLQWQQRLINEFTGGNEGIGESLAAMYNAEPAVIDEAGIDREVMKFLAQASRAAP